MKLNQIRSLKHKTTIMMVPLLIMLITTTRTPRKVITMRRKRMKSMQVTSNRTRMTKILKSKKRKLPNRND